jgi:hypothetical protein
MSEDRKPFRILKAAFLGATLLLVVSAFFTGGWQPAVAALSGTAATLLYLYFSWLMIRGFGAAHGGDGLKPPHPLIIFTAVLMKLPVIWLAWKSSELLGPHGPPFFLGGLALVYCALVGWGTLSNRT